MNYLSANSGNSYNGSAGEADIGCTVHSKRDTSGYSGCDDRSATLRIQVARETTTDAGGGDGKRTDGFVSNLVILYLRVA